MYEAFHLLITLDYMLHAMESVNTLLVRQTARLQHCM